MNLYSSDWARCLHYEPNWNCTCGYLLGAPLCEFKGTCVDYTINYLRAGWTKATVNISRVMKGSSDCNFFAQRRTCYSADEQKKKNNSPLSSVMFWLKWDLMCRLKQRFPLKYLGRWVLVIICWVTGEVEYFTGAVTRNSAADVSDCISILSTLQRIEMRFHRLTWGKRRGSRGVHNLQGQIHDWWSGRAGGDHVSHFSGRQWEKQTGADRLGWRFLQDSSGEWRSRWTASRVRVCTESEEEGGYKGLQSERQKTLAGNSEGPTTTNDGKNVLTENKLHYPAFEYQERVWRGIL